ncbi:MAG: diguanylate cyclase, partial [Burkholderiales bacterium]|nr:diguanylate cyclase [Burkholderiales bacterium]
MIDSVEPGPTAGERPAARAEDRQVGRGGTASSRGVLTLAVVVIAFIVATALLTARSLSQVVASQEALTQTILFDKALQALQVHLVDAETGQRGYLLTGRIGYLQPYFAALGQVRIAQSALGEVQHSHGEFQALLGNLQQAIDVKLQELDHTIRLKEEGREAEALELVKTDAGKQAMDAVRSAVAALIAAEDRQTAVRREIHRREVRNTYAIFGISLLLNVTLLVVLVQRMRADAARSAATRAAMQARNAELSGLLRATTTRNEHIQALTELSRYLQSALHIDEAARLLQQHLPQLMKAEGGALYLMAASRNQLRRACTWGDGSWVECLEPAECWALRRGQPIRHAAEGGITACAHLAAHGKPTNPTLATIECMPLMAHGDLIGLLVVGGHSRQQTLSPDEEQYLQMTLEQVALSIGNLRLRESLRQQSIRDVLTGLYNRRFLEESVQRELLRAGRMRDQGQTHGLAVMMLDVDHFKRFNDQHGHDIGDKVLREVAQVLLRITRGSDVAARYGGEEFVVILPETHAEAALQRADDLRRDVEKLTLHADGQVLD